MARGVVAIPLSQNGAVSAPARPASEFFADGANLLLLPAFDSLAGDAPRYNPLVLCGPPGCGKTSLGLALVARWTELHGAEEILETTGADFARAYAHAVDTNSVDDFRRRIGRCRLFFLDNLGEIEGKESALAELRVALDRLTSSSRQVVITCKRLPDESPRLPEGLKGRLSRGLCLSVALPGPAARLEIAQAAAAAGDCGLAAGAVERLAREFTGSAPQLIGALLEVTHRSRQGGEDSQELLEDFLHERQFARSPALRTITSRVARHFRVPVEHVRGATRRQEVVRARRVAMYLARRLTSKSLQEIGRHFDGRDHTTVLHACRKTESLLAGDAETRHAVDTLTRELDARHERSG